jgi:hypothetical protein
MNAVHAAELAACLWSGWFHGKIERKDADALLEEGQAGSFLIRVSANSICSYVLSFCGPAKIQHFPITVKGPKFECGGRQFESLAAIVLRYKAHPLIDDTKLQFQIAPSRVHLGVVVKQPHQPQPAVARECAVCMAESVCIRLEPCGHQVLCQSCVDELVGMQSRSNKGGNCPICRAAFAEYTQAPRFGLLADIFDSNRTSKGEFMFAGGDVKRTLIKISSNVGGLGRSGHPITVSPHLSGSLAQVLSQHRLELRFAHAV